MTAPRETPGTAPARCPGPSRAHTQDELLAALEAERSRPEVDERIAGMRLPPAAFTDALNKLIALLAQLFQKEHA